MGKWSSFSPERNENLQKERAHFWKGAKYTGVIQRTTQGVKYSLSAFRLKPVTILQSLLNKWHSSHTNQRENPFCGVSPDCESQSIFVQVQASEGQGYIQAEHIMLEGVMLRREANLSWVFSYWLEFICFCFRPEVASSMPFANTVTSGATWHIGKLRLRTTAPAWSPHERLSEDFSLSARHLVSSDRPQSGNTDFSGLASLHIPEHYATEWLRKQKTEGRKTKKVEKADCAIQII